MPTELGTLRCVIKRCVIDVQGEEISAHRITKRKEEGREAERKTGCELLGEVLHPPSTPPPHTHTHTHTRTHALRQTLHGTDRRSSTGSPRRQPCAPFGTAPGHGALLRAAAPARTPRPRCAFAPRRGGASPSWQRKGQLRRKINKSLLIMKY